MTDLTNVLIRKGYDYIGPIGRGGTSLCYAVKSIKYATVFVCKQIYIDGTVCTDCEINALKGLSSPNIISLYDYVIEQPWIYLFIEYCPKGSLADFVVKNGPLKDKLVLGIYRNLIAGLAYMHDKKYAHMDIKANNVLIDRYGRTKIADFGMSRIFQPTDNSKSNKIFGTIAYMSPEIHRNTAYDPFKADIWALGITFYLLICGRLPWASQTPSDQANEILSGGLRFWPSGIPSQIRSLVNAMCSIDPAKRPTAQQLLSWPIFKGIDAKDGFIPETTGMPLVSKARLSQSGQNGNREVVLKQLTSQPRFTRRKGEVSHMRRISAYHTQGDYLLLLNNGDDK